jgi:uncharacterized membrane protein (DUF373 family)
MPLESTSATAFESRWYRFVRGFERVVVKTLMALLMLIVAVATVELGWLLLRDVASIRVSILGVEEMFELFGFFLLVFIGVELLTTLKTYLVKGMIQGEVVLEVALIAVAQKVIVLDTTRANPLTLLALAALILALAAAFFWMRSGASEQRPAPPRRPSAEPNEAPHNGPLPPGS